MNFNDYPKMSVATDIVIFAMEDIKTDDPRKVPEKGLQVLLINRNIDPYKNMLSLPGGFVDINKDIYEAAKAKLEMKTGIDNVYMEQLFTYGQTNRDVRGRVISVAHMALVRKSDISMNNAAWYWVIPERDNTGKVIGIHLENDDNSQKITELAFDHVQMITDAFNRVFNKIEYTNVAFNFVPEYFTVKELEMVYQAILGKKLQGFRRNMGDKIISTNIKNENGSAYRPAEYYKYNENHTKKF